MRPRLRLAGFNINWVTSGGVLILAALLPLALLPSLSGEGTVPFLICFTVAGLVYVFVLLRLRAETPPLAFIWLFAVCMRLIMLFTSVSLSNDVYRYAWDGHLMGQGINPYAEPVNSPLLDLYDTPLRDQVIFPWMSTPYLPAAQAYFALVDRIAPLNPFAFQVGAAVLDLLAGWMVLLTLRQFQIPDKAVLVYLWNPLVAVEFAHGAHVDALMVFFTAAAVWGLARAGRAGSLLSPLFLAASVLVKGWPLFMAPVFARRWGLARTILFGTVVIVPLVLFAGNAGWGLTGPADGRGVFGAVRIYSAEWEFNSGLYYWLARLLTPEVARLLGLLVPTVISAIMGWRLWKERTNTDSLHLVRQAAYPFAAYLLLAHTIHPWYITLMLVMLPFFWPAIGEHTTASRWIWPWIYFMFFKAFTYLSYTGIDAPQGLPLIQTAAYLPFWILLLWSAQIHTKIVRAIRIPIRSFRNIIL